MANYLKIKGQPAGFPGATPSGTTDLYIPIKSITAVYYNSSTGFDQIKIQTDTSYGENGWALQLVNKSGDVTNTQAEAQSVVDAIGDALFANSGNGVVEVQGVFNRCNSFEYTQLS
jgi:hypothetical protein